MKNKIIVLLIIISSVLGFGLTYSYSLAQNNSQDNNSGSSVYAKDLSISSTSLSPGEKITGNFTVYNIDASPASNNYYRISLIDESGSSTSVLDSVSGSNFTLNGSESRNISFSYQIPNISGNLTLQVSVFSASGLELAMLEKGVTISGNLQALSIVSSNVSAGGNTYTLEEGPTISSTSTDSFVVIDLKNTTGSAVTVTPNVQIFKKTVVSGSPIKAYSGTELTLNNNETREVKIAIEPPTTPEVYEGQVTFSNDGNVAIPQTAFRFIVAGEIATVQSVSLENNVPDGSSSLPVVISYTGTPTDISNGQTTANYPIMIKVGLFDSKGNLIGSGNLSTILADSGSEVVPVTLTTKENGNVTAQVSIVGEMGNVLSQGTYSLGEVKGPSSNIFTFLNILYGLIIIIILLVLVIMFINKKSTSIMVLLALVLSGGLILTASQYNANAQVNATYSTLGCSYQQYALNQDKTSKLYSVGNKTTYVAPCTVPQINTLSNTCQYVTINPKITPGKTGYYTVHTNTSCQSVDISNQICSITGTNGKITTVQNCSQGAMDSDSLAFNNATTCTIDYTDHGRATEVTKQNCTIIDATGGGATCTYALGNKVYTVNDCQSIDSNQATQTAKETHCSVDYTSTNSRGNVSNYAKNYANCSNISYVASTGICSFTLNGKTSETQTNCTGIYNYAETLDIIFTSLSPQSNGQITYNPGDIADFAGYVYYPKCTNTPASAAASFILLDPQGNLVPASYIHNKFSKGATCSDSDGKCGFTITDGHFDENLTAPSTPGKYTLEYTISYANTLGNGKTLSSTKTGYLNFFVGSTSTVPVTPTGSSTPGNPDNPSCDPRDPTCLNSSPNPDKNPYNPDATDTGKSCSLDNVCGDGITGDIYSDGSCRPAPGYVQPACKNVTATFSADPVQVNPGKTCTLNWDSTNADGCTITDDKGNDMGVTDTSGSTSTLPIHRSTVYQLSCKNKRSTASLNATCRLNPDFKEI